MVFRLCERHIAGLSPVERRIYGGLIGKVQSNSLKDEYEALCASRYHEGDENILPYPERSKRGIMLTSAAQNLALCQSAVILKVRHGWARYFIQQKLLSLGQSRVYSLANPELLAALWATLGLEESERTPFDWYRRKKPLSELPGLTGRVLCALDPPNRIVTDNDEWSVAGALVRPANDPSAIAHFSELAKLGLTRVTALEQEYTPQGIATEENCIQIRDNPESRDVPNHSNNPSNSKGWLWVHR